MRSARTIPSFGDSFAGLGYDLATLQRRLEDTGERDELAAVDLRRAWRACTRDGRQGRIPALFGFYIHVPFCLHRCAYCRHFKARLESPAQLERYVATLLDAFEYFAPALAGARFTNLIVGGGTPGLLGPPLLDRLLTRLFAWFEFDPIHGDRAIEFNPAGVTAEQLAVLARHGFRRVSMGVQSLSPRVLGAQDRGYQTRRVVERAFRLVRDSGIPQLCVDLIAGLAGDDPTTFRTSFAELATLGPDQITVYPLVPMRSYVDRAFGGDFDAFLDRRREFLEQVVPWMRTHAARHGYAGGRERETAGDNCWVFDRVGARPLAFAGDEFYDEASPVPASILGLGPGAHSLVRGRLGYTDCGPIPDRFDPRERRYWVVRRSRDDELRHFVLMSMRKHGEVSRDRFRRYFGVGLLDEFGPAARKVVATGLAELSPQRLRVLPDDPADRFRCAVPFLDPRALRRALQTGRAPAAPLLRFASRGFAVDLAVEHARQDETYLLVVKGLGLRLVYAGEQRTPRAHGDADREALLRPALRAFAAVVRASHDRRPAPVLAGLHHRLRPFAARRGLVCRRARPEQ